MTDSLYSSNREIFQSPDIVNYYSTLEGLQKPEEAILNLLLPDLKHMRMLDIGVGAGRTSRYFAGIVKEYIGIDYSEKMIEACRDKFKEKGKHIVFEVGDARTMNNYDNDSFDFILFSFNGIDNVSYDDRIKILMEVKRVLKPGAYFYFSAHNIQSIKKFIKINATLNVRKLLSSLKYFIRLIIANRQYKGLWRKDYAFVNDGAHDFKLLTYYIKPAAQTTQLKNLGFKNIQIFSLADGSQIHDNLEKIEDQWLYYLCEKD
jgi:ubiquinone/menaquinone biosynthesis C-methylase UbiE